MSVIGKSADCYYEMCGRCIAKDCACPCHSASNYSVYERVKVKKILKIPKKVSDRPRGRPKKQNDN